MALWRILFSFALPMLWWSLGLAQEADLAYDDGEPGGTLNQLSAGDIEVVRFTPEHPATLVSTRLFFAVEEPCTAHIHVWADNGGNAPDLEQVLFESSQPVSEAGWLLLQIPEDTVVLEVPQHFYVGHVLQEPPCQLAWDGMGSEEARSLARIDGSWYYINDSEGGGTLDALVRATVSYFNVQTERHFENTTASAGLPEGMGRVAWADYDDDGDDDLLVGGNRLFSNNSDGTFSEVTEEAGIGGQPTNGGVWADYDNDGYLDFYATVHNYLRSCARDNDCHWCTIDESYSCAEYHDDHSCVDGRCMPPSGVRPHDLLWRNNGDGTFAEMSEQAGLVYDYLPTEAAAWGDYDNDGFVDLYVANYETPLKWSGGNLSDGNPDYLWRNNGDGTFADFTQVAGMRIFHMDDLCGRGVAWADYDLDGDQDIFVANYRLDMDVFWENVGHGSFVNIAPDNGTTGVPIQGAYGHSIGASWADMDNDGDWDLFVASLAHPRFEDFSDKSKLYESSGPPDFTFTDIRADAGITYSETHSDPAWGDYDNDGYVDLFITDVYVGYLAFLYRNNGDGTFTDATYPAGIIVDNGWGCAWADYDDDGRLDLVTRTLWRNTLQEAGHWLKVRLRGTTSNRAAIGAVVTVEAGSQVMMRQVEGGKGTGNQNSLTLHFGLGDAATVDRLTIRWPSGLEETYDDVAADQTVAYVEGGVQPPPDTDGEDISTTDGGADAWDTDQDTLARPDAADGTPATEDLSAEMTDEVEAIVSDEGCGCHIHSRSTNRRTELWLGLLAAMLALHRRRPRTRVLGM